MSRAPIIIVPAEPPAVSIARQMSAINLEQEVSQSQLDGSPSPTSDPTGFRAAPAHYSQEEREIIDQARDIYSDEVFWKFCLLTAFIYRKRAPFKGTPEADNRKAIWYERMACHVQQPTMFSDPRSDRDDFKPYERPLTRPWKSTGLEVTGTPFSSPHEGPKTWAEEVEAESAGLTFTPDPTTEIPKHAPLTLADTGAVSAFKLVPSGPITVTMPLEGDYIIQADPWPPMSREQVVELHEALKRFRFHMNTLEGAPRETDGIAFTLLEALDRLHIGTPPAPPLTEPAAVKHNCWTCGHSRPIWNESKEDANQREIMGCWAQTYKTMEWMRAVPIDRHKMPPQDSDGCPGWESKE